MAEFIAQSNNRKGRYLQLTITQQKDTENNQSTLHWVLEALGGEDGYYTTVSATKVVIDGQVCYQKGTTYYTEKVFPAGKGSASGSVVVSHDGVGEKTVKVDFTTAVYTGEIQNFGGTFLLDSISQVSPVSCTDAFIGTAPIITIEGATEGNLYTLRYAFESLTGTIVEKTPKTVYKDWVIPESFYAQIPNAPSATATVYCDTYNQDTLVGTSACSIKITADPAVCRPSLAPQITDANGAVSALTPKWVRYHSTAQVKANAYGQKGATIRKVQVVNGGRTLTGESCEFANVESALFTFTATDSRGYTATATVDLADQFLPYRKLTCNLQESKMDASGQMELACFGNYFAESFNTLQVAYRYKVLGGEFGNWRNMGITLTGDGYTASANLSGLDYQSAYIFEIKAEDALMKVTATSKAIKSQPLFHWGKEDFRFHVPVILSDGSQAISLQGVLDLLAKFKEEL